MGGWVGGWVVGWVVCFFRMKGAAIIIPSIVTDGVRALFEQGRVVHSLVAMGNGQVSEPLASRNALFLSVCEEVRSTGAGLPVPVAEDFNVTPEKGPCLAVVLLSEGG